MGNGSTALLRESIAKVIRNEESGAKNPKAQATAMVRSAEWGVICFNFQGSLVHASSSRMVSPFHVRAPLRRAGRVTLSSSLL